MSVIQTIIPKNTFNGGQVSKDVWGKIESEIYGKSLAKMENFLSNPQGSSIFRNGFVYVDELETDKCRFEEFKFNNEQSYIVIFMDKKCAFLSIDVDGNFGFVLNGGKKVEVTLPYSWAEVQKMNVCQTGDIMFITDGVHEIGRLIRKEANVFEFSTLNTEGFPFGADNANEDIKVKPSGTTGNITVTVTGTTEFFTNDDVGKLLSINKPKVVDEEDVQGYVRINSVTKPTEAACTVMQELSSAEETATWARSAFSKRSGYPSACGLYESRLWVGGTNDEPVGFWGSVTNEFGKFSEGVKDTDSVFFRVAEVAERAKWILGGANALLAGTGAGIITVNGGDSVTAITPTSVRAKLANFEGSADIMPTRQNSTVFYVDNQKRKIQLFSYNLLYESFDATNINYLNYDITQSGLKKLVYQNDKHSFIWALKNNGKMIAITFLNQEDLVVNGAFEVTTKGEFREIGTITRLDGTVALVALVKRDGKNCIEIMHEYINFPNQDDFYSENAEEDLKAYKRAVFEQLKNAIHLDSAVTYRDLRNVALTYSNGALNSQTTVFNENMVGRQIWVKSDEEGNGEGRYLINSFVNNKKVLVTPLLENNDTSFSSWYLTANKLTGISRFNGKKVRVVADGNDLGDHLISGGSLTLPNQHSVIHIGYAYIGIMKSLNLGYQIQGVSTQLTAKSIVSIILRLFNSWGGECGSDIYNLEEISEFSNNGNYDEPPMPINGDEVRNIRDNFENSKQYFILQKKALPFNISMLGYNLSQNTGG